MAPDDTGWVTVTPPAQQQPDQPPTPSQRDQFIDAIMHEESGGKPFVVSGKGARGLMQTEPATALNPGYGVKPIQAPTWEEEARVGHDFAGAMYDAYGGDTTLAAAAYNAGPGRLNKWISQYGDPRKGDLTSDQFAKGIPIAETNGYVRRVNARLAAAAPPLPDATSTIRPYEGQSEDSGQTRPLAAEVAPDDGWITVTPPAPAPSDDGWITVTPPPSFLGSLGQEINAGGSRAWRDTVSGAVLHPAQIIAQKLGEWTGSEGLQKAAERGAAVRDAFDAETAQRFPASVQSAGEALESPAKAAQYVAGKVGEAVPTAAEFLMAPELALPAMVLSGGIGGGTRAYEKTGSLEDAAEHAVIEGALNAVPVPLLHGAAGKSAIEQVARGAAGMGLVGGASPIAEKIPGAIQSGNPADLAVSPKDIAEGAAAGAVQGAFFGGVGALHGRPEAEAPKMEGAPKPNEPGNWKPFLNEAGQKIGWIDEDAGNTVYDPIRPGGGAGVTTPESGTSGQPGTRGQQPPAPGSVIGITFPDGPRRATVDSYSKDGLSIRVTFGDGKSTDYLTHELLRDQVTPPEPPKTAPAAPSTPPERERIDLTGMGKGVTDSLYEGLFAALKDGKDTYAGLKDPILVQARSAFENGDIKSPDDLKAWVQGGQYGARPTPPPKPVEAPTAPEVDKEAAKVAPNPTDAQKAAGNYQKGHVDIGGLDVTIETPKGAERTGTDPDGKPWTVTMPAHYGYIKGTEGADKEHVDAYIGPNPQSDKAFIVDQRDAKTGVFDEHKVMLGFDDATQAAQTYVAGFSDGRGWDRLGSMKPTSIDGLKDWLKEGRTTKPAAPQKIEPPPIAESKPTETAAPPPATETPPPPKTDAQGRTPIGTNADGNQIFEDKSGVRSYVQDGNRVTEPKTSAAKPPSQKPDDFQVAPIAAPKAAPVEKPGPRPPDLLEFLASKGGVQDQTGELRAMDAHLWHRDKPFQSRFMRPDGQPPDYAREAAAEAGYPVGPDLQSFYAAVQENLTGRRVYSDRDASGVANWQANRDEYDGKFRDDAERRADELGIDHTPEMPTEHLLAEIHEREAMQAEHPADASDRIATDLDHEAAANDIPWWPGESHEQGNAAAGAAAAEAPRGVAEGHPAPEGAPGVGGGHAAEPEGGGAPPAKGPSLRLADQIADRLWTDRDKPITAKELQDMAETAYGGKLAEGKFDRKDLYDALELGVNRYIQRDPVRFDPRADIDRARETAVELEKLKASLPTQTVRSAEQISHQQFSTPPDYAYAASWVARLRPEDRVLEPSAGTGSLAVHAMNAGVDKVFTNELSPRRGELVGHLKPDRQFQEDAEQLHNILPDDIKPSVVIMNPPFSQTAGRLGDKKVVETGANHIDQALKRLDPGGRLVAIVGRGMGFDASRFKPWWAKTLKNYDVRANIGVDGKVYSKYGTNFGTRLLVIDKQPPSGRAPVTGDAQDIPILMTMLEGVRNGRQLPRTAPSEQPADQSHGQTVAAPGGGLGPGIGLRPAAGAPGVRAGSVDTGAGERLPAGGVGPSEPPHAPEAGGPNAVARVEPGWGRPGGAEPNAPPATGGGADLGGGGPGGHGVDLRPPGGGEPVLPAGGERGGVAPERVRVDEAIASPEAGSGVTEAVYEPYKPQRVTVAGAKAHPGELVQSAAMASVLPPKVNYAPRLPKKLITSGTLSDAQLESTVYIGHAHSQMLPTTPQGETFRRGFMIGDGTGTGKGREISAAILDNIQQGRNKHIWVTEKKTLINDARRDWSALGQDPKDIFDIGKTKAGADIKGNKGILFSTYDTLKTAERLGKDEKGKTIRGKSRVDQIVKWVGPDFDGVIALDESHNLANSVSMKGARGVKDAAAKALAGIELQRRLPNARVVYASATGATEVANLAYAERLGLWGKGTAFPTRDKFINEIQNGGIAAMELVARDMKSMGSYLARSLSYRGVDYDRIEHPLSPQQRGIYDKLAEGWQTVLNNFNEALKETGGDKNSDAKSAALSAFWGGHQRFFNQVITSMQMPSVLKAIEKDIKAKRQVVLQLVNTNEASQERAIAKVERPEDLEDLDMTPRDQLMQLVERSFPVAQHQEYKDDNGNIRSEPVVDSNGKVVENKEAVAMRERLLDQLGDIRVPEGPLEMLLNHFGHDKISEVTGRGRRVVKAADENGRIKTVVQNRSASANVVDADDFQAGKKKILVFSDAGGTGRSYHADNTSASKDARRSHYLLQAGWRADKAIQGFGRTHRTNQASAPIFHLVTTDLQGQRRFISSIARRLSQLGALTKGERRTGDQGMFSAKDNLESSEARDALQNFFRDLYADRMPEIGIDDFERQTGLKLRDRQGNMVAALPEIPQFLNRLLSLKVDMQNRVFSEFETRLESVVDRAAATGTLDTGVEVLKADRLSKTEERPVYTDPSGAETKYVKLKAETKNNPATFDQVSAGARMTGGNKPTGWVKSNRSGKVYAMAEARPYTDPDTGNIVDQYRLVDPLRWDFVNKNSVDNIAQKNWTKLSEPEARAAWEKQVAAIPEYRSEDIHLISGAVLPIWDRLAGKPKIYRLQTDAGEKMLGRVIPSAAVDGTLKALGAERTAVKSTPKEVADKVLDGGTAQMANGWKIRRSMVAGEPRLELSGPSWGEAEELKSDGVFSERIQYQTRYFIPTGPEAEKVIERITQRRPVTDISMPDRNDVALQRGVRGERMPFAADFPNVVVQLPPDAEARLRQHPDYALAKAGDIDAAKRVTSDVVTPAKVAELRTLVGDRKPELVPVHAEEASGRNKLPAAYATVLGRRLGLDVGTDIVQANRAHRTGMSPLRRITTPVEFEGPVTPGRDYLLVDDFLTQGGTLADLKGYIEGKGGKVIGATTLSAAPDGHILAPRPATLEALRAKFPGLEDWWHGRYGHGFDSITDQEGRYLLRSNSAQSVRNQLAAGGPEGDGAQDRGGAGPGGAAEEPVAVARGLSGIGEFRPTDTFTKNEAALVKAVEDIARRIAPGAELRGFRRLVEEPDQDVTGAFYRTRRGDAIARVVAYSLSGPHPVEAVRHELIHDMRRSGLLSDHEWDTLASAAENSGWMEKHNTLDRYPDLSYDRQLEEAVADEFSLMQRPGKLAERLPAPVRYVFDRLRQILRQVGAAARRVLGKDATANDVFANIESGKIGQRAVSGGDETIAYQRRGAFNRLTPAQKRRLMAVAELDRLDGRDRQDDGRSVVVRNDNHPEAQYSKPGDTITLDPTSSKAYFARKAAPIYPPTATGTIARTVNRLGDHIIEKAPVLLDIRDDVERKISPMAMTVAPNEARATAKDFANYMRLSRWEWSRVDKALSKRFSPEQQERMWNAADEESVLRQQGLSTTGKGLDWLPPEERKAVEELQASAQEVFDQARDLGITKAEGLPSYTPRMVVRMAEGVSSPVRREGLAGSSLTRIGSNLRTTTGQMKHRKYLTAEETEAAAKEHFGDEAEIARNIRALPLATAKLQEAVAGRSLINQIKEIGQQTGQELVTEGREPSDGGFTIDHPAFRTWRPRFETNAEGKVVPVRNGAGEIVFDKVPIYVRKDWEGPLRSVLTEPSGQIYRTAMELKGKTMGVVMYSPLIHNAVEYGRALPAMPGKVVFGRVYSEGKVALNDPATMRELIEGGMVPIGGHGFKQDITSIMNEPNIKPGRSWTAQAAGLIPGLFDPRKGDAVKRWVDKAGDFWHNTLLWDQVAKLQAGLAVNFRDHLIQKGFDRQTAVRIAAHLANRYAGALPKEAMGDMAQKIANMVLFSRTFTLGNLGAMKDAIKGLPRDVQAQILRDAGATQLKSAQGYMKRKAMATIALDIALMYAGNSILQSALAVMAGRSTLDDEAEGYVRRLQAAAQHVRENPLDLAMPWRWPNLINRLSSTWDNEPGKQDRILVGHAADGTAIYMRNPVGKIGEEFTGWMTGPIDMLHRKLGTVARPLVDLFSNDIGFGRHLYNPDPKTASDYLANARDIALDFMGDQLPMQAIQAASDRLHGRGDWKLQVLQTAGPLAGATFSKGAPGGPGMGDIYAVTDRQKYLVGKELPIIRRMIQDGDFSGATKAMMDLKLPGGYQNWIVKTTLNPAARLSQHEIKEFNLNATPEEQEHFRLLQAQSVKEAQERRALEQGKAP